MNHSVRTLRFTKNLFTDCHIRFYCSEANTMKGLVLGVHCNSKQDFEFTPSAKCFNDANEGKLQNLLSLVRTSMKPGKVKLFYALNTDFETVALVGLPKKEKTINELENLDEYKEGVRIAASAGCRGLQEEGIEDIAIETLTDAEAAAEGAFLGTWKFQEFKTSAAGKTPPKIRNYENEQLKEWNVGRIKADCQNIARRLMDMPSNKMTPSVFANVAEKLLKPSGVEVNAYGVNWIKEHKMGAFLSVTKGSSEPAVFLEIKYKRGAENADPIVLVGKGVTFDSGGISLKKAGSMDEMRADMGGAACVLSTILAIAQLDLPISVTGLMPLCENMPSGSATKPGDIVTAMNGKTIAVDNTDAEGRLILADALCYASTLKPKFTLDIATLTGAMHVAIGGAATGVFSTSSHLWNELNKAGMYSGDRVWRFPLWKFYTKQMTDFSSVDINNLGKGKGGGSCTAAAFLREFAPPGEWLHLDMAGVMGPSDDTPYLHKGMTGRPVRTLTQFLTQLATHENDE